MSQEETGSVPCPKIYILFRIVNALCVSTLSVQHVSELYVVPDLNA